MSQLLYFKVPARQLPRDPVAHGSSSSLMPTMAICLIRPRNLVALLPSVSTEWGHRVLPRGTVSETRDRTSNMPRLLAFLNLLRDERERGLGHFMPSAVNGQ